VKKRFVKFAGYAVLIFCLIFLGQRFYSNFGNLIAIRLEWKFYAALFAASIGYGVLQLLLVAALSVTLKGLGATGTHFSKVLNFHGRTDIAKYLPGNVFHFAGRQLMAKSFGWSQATVGLASLAETSLVIIGAGLGALLYGALANMELVSKNLLPIDWRAMLFTASAGIGAVWFLCANAAHIPWLAGYAGAQNIQKFSRSLRPLLAITYYTLFFLIGGVMFWLLLAGMRGEWGEQFLTMAGFAYVASWLAGKISPGASAGIGVREAILVLIMGPTLGEAEALVLALGMRVVSVIGDFLLLAMAMLFRPETPKQETP